MSIVNPNMIEEVSITFETLVDRLGRGWLGFWGIRVNLLSMQSQGKTPSLLSSSHQDMSWIKAIAMSLRLSLLAGKGLGRRHCAVWAQTVS